MVFRNVSMMLDNYRSTGILRRVPISGKINQCMHEHKLQNKTVLFYQFNFIIEREKIIAINRL